MFSITRRFLDRDGDGLITVNDFLMIVYSMGLGGLGDRVAINVFNELDLNRDGVLDRFETMNALNILKGRVNYNPYNPYGHHGYGHQGYGYHGYGHQGYGHHGYGYHRPY